MGLIYNLIMSVIHLIFVAMDALLIMILIKVVYSRWHFTWLKPFADMVTPAVDTITRPVGTWLLKVTGKTHTEKTRLIVLVLGLSFVRLVICGLV